MLILIIGIAVSGLMMKWFHTDIFAVKQFFLGLMYFNWAEFHQILFYCYTRSCYSADDYFPYSKLLHAPGLFLVQQEIKLILPETTDILRTGQRNWRHINKNYG